jgi:hypothetical protein
MCYCKPKKLRYPSFIGLRPELSAMDIHRLVKMAPRLKEKHQGYSEQEIKRGWVSYEFSSVKVQPPFEDVIQTRL